MTIDFYGYGFYMAMGLTRKGTFLINLIAGSWQLQVSSRVRSLRVEKLVLLVSNTTLPDG